MPNLNYYRKLRFPTIKAFAQAASITPSIASQWLQANRSDINPDPLCTLLGISQEEYTAAYQLTRDEERKKWREKHPPTMTPEEWDASIKETADRIYARMSPGQKQQLASSVAQRQSRSPLDMMIDQACGLK